MPVVEFVGQSSQDPDNRAANPSRLINCYREVANGRTQFVVKAVLGQSPTPLVSLGATSMRAVANVGGVIYAAVGGKLFSITSAGLATELGTITDSSTTSISSNNGKVTIAAGGNYYVWDGTTLTQPATGAFASFGDVTFMGQITLLSELNGRRVQFSDVADPSTLDGLRFATAEQRDDAILRMAPIGGELWVFKATSIERWYQTGVDFAYIPGSGMKPGLKSRNLLVEIRNAVFFVGSDGKAYIAGGGEMKPISIPAVETSIASQSPQQCFFYSDEGHDFCVITFQNRPAWVFDMSMGEWHERGDGETLEAWAVANCVEAFGGFYVADDAGKIWLLARVSTDRGLPLKWLMVSNTLQIEGNRFRVAELRMQGRVGANGLDVAYEEPVAPGGVGGELVVDPEGIRTPQVLLRVSRDHGKTWGQPKMRSLGGLGEFETQIVWRSLGQFRACTVELSGSAPVDAPIDATAFVKIA